MTELKSDLDLFIARKGVSYFVCEDEGRAFLEDYFARYAETVSVS